MSVLSIPDTRLAGLASCVPRGRVSNLDYALLSMEERQKLVRTTGIEHRHRAAPGQCASDLCCAAAEQLLSELGWARDEVEALVYVTQGPDYVVPPTANLLQDRLGLTSGCLCLDVNLGCSGYVYGLLLLSSLLTAGRLRKGLLLVGDVSGWSVSEQDRSTWPLFADAGAATALEWAPGAPPAYFEMGGDGSGYQAILRPHGGHRGPITAESLVYEEFEGDIRRNKVQVVLDGIEVFNFSLREVPRMVRGLLEATGTSAEQLDAVVFHQANLLMLELIRKKLKLPAQKVPYSLRDYGNTSSASIPLTISASLGEPMRAGRQRLLLCGFGVGLSWGTALIETDRVICPAVLEV